MRVVAGVDLGGTSINSTLLNQQEKFLIEGLFEYPAFAKQGPEKCLRQIADGLQIATDKAGIHLQDVIAVGLDTPGPPAPRASSVPEAPQTLSIRSGPDSISGRAWRAVSVSR